MALRALLVLLHGPTGLIITILLALWAILVLLLLALRAILVLLMPVGPVLVLY